MSITELLNSVQLVTDREGNKKGVVLDWQTWEGILELLEDLEDEEEMARIKEAKAAGEVEVIPWEQAKEELRTEGVDV